MSIMQSIPFNVQLYLPFIIQGILLFAAILYVLKGKKK